MTGDRVAGPLRRARRSERHPSLIRVATINGVAADESVSGTRLEELDAEFPSTLIPLGEDDPTLAAIGFYAPIGRGSRVILAGPARSGKTEAIKRLAGVLAGIDDLEVEVLLVGVRPEELREWKESTIATVSGLTFAATADVRAAAVEQAVERARRIAARGGDAALLIDTLDGLHPPVVRRALAAARNVRDGGSLTIIATAEQADRRRDDGRRLRPGACRLRQPCRPCDPIAQRHDPRRARSSASRATRRSPRPAPSSQAGLRSAKSAVAHRLGQARGAGVATARAQGW